MSVWQILKKPELVFPHITQVAAAADANRDALGFLPASAYGELAAQGKLWVGVIGGAYAGHLAFGEHIPT